jgi:sec-independent protein translocase protein TatC
MAAPVRRRPRLRFRRRAGGAASNDATMTMMEHLGELRTRLIVSAAAFAVVSAVAFFVFQPIASFLLRPLCSLPKDQLGPQGCRLVVTGVLEPFVVRLKVTAVVAMVITSPVWLYELWAFISPGLRSNEKRLAGPFVGSSIALFAIGAVFAYLTLPFGLRFLLGLGGHNLVPFLKADSYLNFVLLLIVVFGITFEIPLLMMFLALAGVVSLEQLVHHRKAALVGAFIVGAVVTPTQDPYTMSAMAIPLYVFYELVILILRIRARRRARL